MIFNNVTRDSEGNYHFGISAEPDEINFLVSMAVSMMLDAGAINVDPDVSGEQVVELPEEAQTAMSGPSTGKH